MDSQEKSDQSAATDVPVSRRSILLGGTALVAASALIASNAAPQRAKAQEQPTAPYGGKPNILVIWGDDIGFWNLSAYSRGAMGYRTPNIDRIANEGAIFSDHYAQASGTAGRAAFRYRRSDAVERQEVTASRHRLQPRRGVVNSPSDRC